MGTGVEKNPRLPFKKREPEECEGYGVLAVTTHNDDETSLSQLLRRPNWTPARTAREEGAASTWRCCLLPGFPSARAVCQVVQQDACHTGDREEEGCSEDTKPSAQLDCEITQVLELITKSP